MASKVDSFKQWTLHEQKGIESLVLETASLPKKEDIGEYEVLVKLHAASLNYRDLVIARGAKNLQIKPGVIPGSDGAGVVLEIGKSVTKFRKGDKVVTHMLPQLLATTYPTMEDVSNGLGQTLDGTLREYGVFSETGLVHMPENLTFEEAATLTCSGLTAWNVLFGGGRKLKKGESVLTQGTGGVSVAALQFAHAMGATVISTTSSATKAHRLSTLGASHTINYIETPSWGPLVKTLSPSSLGITNVVDVGGLSTLSESMKAVVIEGTVTVTGVLGSDEKEHVGALDVLWRVCSVRGALLGTREQFGEMCKFIEEKGVRPVVDERVFGLEETREAFEYLEGQNHFSKVVIKIC
ncbi:hypothetical protein HYFRA_00000746 [Hymenoscyphus fraxineus]|uniref:Enoyl reductase (ER) domain-containing protein n=1 Tax=Hymenoscyphus fraxineus TaxID=746836 RepID=A0A9N9PQF0_9HELO|nr:hypothetical protein HYFRA_00000746 [Hymenoscyphus fraxineus]